MKYQGLTFPLFLLLATLITLFNASHSTGNTTGACSSCHGSGTSANGSIILTGLPNNGIVVNATTYSMQLCIIDPGKVAAGFRVEADLGTFTDGVDSHTNAANDRITHNFPKGFGSPGNPACWDFDWTSPTTGATDPTFTLRGNAVNGNSSTTGDNGGYFETSQGLPVEFASFDISKSDHAIDIYWTTATEINNDRFVIQRSTDSKEFQNIGSVPGSMHSLDFIDYYFEDLSPPDGLLYYRILQIDLNGTQTYTEIKAIDNSKNLKWTAYPTLIDLNTSNHIFLNNSNNALTLFDYRGNIISTYPKGSYDDMIELNETLSSGIYFLTDGVQTEAVSIFW